MDSTDRLITGLVGDLRPVQTLPPLRRAFALVMAVWAALLGLVLWSQETAPGVYNLASNGLYLTSLVGLLLAALGGTISALAAGQPGREGLESRTLVVALLGLGTALMACLYGMGGLDFAANPSPPGADAMCFREGVMFAILPAAVLLSLLIRGWTAHPHRAALMAAGAVGALGSLVVHLNCDFAGPRHLLIGHLSVSVVLALVALYPLGLILRRLRG